MNSLASATRTEKRSLHLTVAPLIPKYHLRTCARPWAVVAAALGEDDARPRGTFPAPLGGALADSQVQVNIALRDPAGAPLWM